MMKTEIFLGGFRKRSLPLNADYRPLYKIGIIVLILKMVCNGNKSSLSKMHFFIWALKSKANIDLVKFVIDSEDTSSIVSWGVEPALNKALVFGIAEGIFDYNGDKYKLTEKGIELFNKINLEGDLFIEEKKFLAYTGKQKISETLINKLTQNFIKHTL